MFSVERASPRNAQRWKARSLDLYVFVLKQTGGRKRHTKLVSTIKITYMFPN